MTREEKYQLLEASIAQFVPIIDDIAIAAGKSLHPKKQDEVEESEQEEIKENSLLEGSIGNIIKNVSKLKKISSQSTKELRNHIAKKLKYLKKLILISTD